MSNDHIHVLMIDGEIKSIERTQQVKGPFSLFVGGKKVAIAHEVMVRTRMTTNDLLRWLNEKKDESRR